MVAGLIICASLTAVDGDKEVATRSFARTRSPTKHNDWRDDRQIEPPALERASFRPILKAGEKVRAVMIRSQIADMQSVLSDVEVVRQIKTDHDCEVLATRIIQFKHGVKDEDALTRLVI
ncbi:hypothetical protein MF410_32010 (plasmid) [Rhizobium sp. C104]|uniref:hypothetical protein n=1 Tax=Rhizobium sp. C104 TaxID=2917727 RepID=UPI001EF75CF0|nr:hypothetical protein [Rhizobium sp. C104]ULJ82375.1 hypothetical protein MF410_32010 [Rhizobium sp. C104]